MCNDLYLTTTTTNAVLFLFSASMGTIYAENKDEDGFLYVAYSGENTFGD